MYWLKSCPRCSGDLAESADLYGTEVLCLHCGHSLAANDAERLRRTGGEAARSRRWKERQHVHLKVANGLPIHDSHSLRARKAR